MQPKHIFICVPTLYAPGGIEAYSRDLIQAIGETTPCTVLSLEDRRRQHADFPVKFVGHHLRPRLLEQLWFSLSFAWRVWRQRPTEVVFTHRHLALLGWLFCRPLGIPYSVVLHGAEAGYRVRGLGKSALLRAKRLFATSDFMAGIFSKWQKVPRNRFEILPCSIDTKRFRPGKPSQELREKLNLSEEKVLLTISRLGNHDTHKGVDVVMEALPLIRNTFPRLRYVVVGGGGWKGALKELAREVGVADWVSFVGPIPENEKLDYYRLADCFVMPSNEGFGIVYLEALACGVPVVAADNDGSIAPLQNGELGWRVPPKDIQAVADACVEALKKTDRRTDPEWLRSSTEAAFSKSAFEARVQAFFGGLGSSVSPSKKTRSA